MKMNLPNKLTVLRVLMIPVFVVFMMLSVGDTDITVLRAELPESFRMYRYLAFAVFCLASFTDFLDGQIARRCNLVTDFGKFMDPLADKLLVCTAMILLTAEGSLSVLAVILIIAREFIISGFRLVASDNGVVIAASYWGKFKTTFQMLMVIVIIFNINLQLGWLNILGTILIYVSLVLTVVSLIDYIAKNKDVLKDQK